MRRCWSLLKEGSGGQKKRERLERLKGGDSFIWAGKGSPEAPKTAVAPGGSVVDPREERRTGGKDLERRLQQRRNRDAQRRKRRDNHLPPPVGKRDWLLLL